jgi:hypothetical protein
MKIFILIMASYSQGSVIPPSKKPVHHPESKDTLNHIKMRKKTNKL